MDVYIVFKSEPYDFEIFSDFDTAKTAFVNILLTEWKKRCHKEGLSEQETSLYTNKLSEDYFKVK